MRSFHVHVVLSREPVCTSWEVRIRSAKNGCSEPESCWVDMEGLSDSGLLAVPQLLFAYGLPPSPHCLESPVSFWNVCQVTPFSCLRSSHGLSCNGTWTPCYSKQDPTGSHLHLWALLTLYPLILPHTQFRFVPYHICVITAPWLHQFHCLVRVVQGTSPRCMQGYTHFIHSGLYPNAAFSKAFPDHLVLR